MDISAYQHMNIRMSTRGKRPLRNLTPNDKVRAIQRIHNGETKASVSRDIGVPESTLRGWCKNEQKLRFMCRQLGAVEPLNNSLETPPEKRSRFDNHLQNSKYTNGTNFDEFGYSRLPLSGLNFPTASNNAILEKIALNEIMRKHALSGDNGNDRKTGNSTGSTVNTSNQPANAMMGAMPLGSDYSQLAMLQNLNFLSALNPSLAGGVTNFEGSTSQLDGFKEKLSAGIMNGSTNDTKENNDNVALTVKDWAKGPIDTTTSQSNGDNSIDIITEDIKDTNNDSNNNTVKDNNKNAITHNPTNGFYENLDRAEYQSLPLSVPMLPIPNLLPLNAENNPALLEWYKIFNASLNFLALAAAAATFQPSNALTNGDNSLNIAGRIADSTKSLERPEEHILYKELTKNEQNANISPNLGTEISSDSFFDSEPEDLSVRSAVIHSKTTSPVRSRSSSPVKLIKTDDCSPSRCDTE